MTNDQKLEIRRIQVIGAGIGVLLLTVALLAAAQNQPLAFEVASVKPTPPEGQNLLRKDFSVPATEGLQSQVLQLCGRSHTRHREGNVGFHDSMDRGGIGSTAGGVCDSCFAAGRYFPRAVEEERLPVRR